MMAKQKSNSHSTCWLIKGVCDAIKEIIDFLYPSFLLELESAETRIHFHQHAILEPKNEVDKIIEYMLNQMLGDSWNI